MQEQNERVGRQRGNAGPVVRAALALGFLASSAAADISVTNLSDDGPGSLRMAIASAVPGESITFAVTGTIVLTTGELVLYKDVTINGPGQLLLRISGNTASRVLSVDPGVTANIHGVTIGDGFLLSGSGAGVLNKGNLGLFNCAIVDNQIHALGSTGGGGISNTATLTAINCSVSNNDAHIVSQGGGGIHNTGLMELSGCSVSSNTAELANGGGVFNAAGASLTFSQCTIAGNDADDGGGVQNVGLLMGFNSTLASNTADSFGGGMRNYGTATMRRCTVSANSAVVWGGGIMNWNNAGPATLTMTNCTISGNLADLGGGLSNFDVATLSNCTVTANAFGIENLGPLNVKNSIIADNLYLDCLEPFTAMTGTNYDSDGSCGAGFTQVTPAQLQLAGLANNGGPTATHALLVGSIAMDQASDCSDFFGIPVPADQRGVPRAQGPGCDVGAFEFVKD